MQTNTSRIQNNQTRLRAIVEIGSGGELSIYPLADNDAEEARIMDGLRFTRREFKR